MGAKHTPGPWVADEYPHGDVWHIRYGKRGNWLAEVMTDGDHKGAAADARLIASAPDLLEALQSLVANLAEGDFISETRIDAARAAIARATGEAA
jgi:hypothetical protein